MNQGNLHGFAPKPPPSYVQVTKLGGTSTVAQPPTQTFTPNQAQEVAHHNPPMPPQQYPLSQAIPSHQQLGGERAQLEEDYNEDDNIAYGDESESESVSEDDTQSEGGSINETSSSSESDFATFEENDTEEHSGGASYTESSSTVSTTELLGRDPLFLVLSQFLMSDDGGNIVDALMKINKHLSKLVKVFEQKKEKKNDRRIKK